LQNQKAQQGLGYPTKGLRRTTSHHLGRELKQELRQSHCESDYAFCIVWGRQGSRRIRVALVVGFQPNLVGPCSHVPGYEVTGNRFVDALIKRSFNEALGLEHRID
jgi:hypothetical protein